MYNSLVLHELPIQYFHPVSYAHAVFFGLRRSSGLLMQKKTQMKKKCSKYVSRKGALFFQPLSCTTVPCNNRIRVKYSEFCKKNYYSSGFSFLEGSRCAKHGKSFSLAT